MVQLDNLVVPPISFFAEPIGSRSFSQDPEQGQVTGLAIHGSEKQMPEFKLISADSHVNLYLLRG
jgi:hypothetical protein